MFQRLREKVASLYKRIMVVSPRNKLVPLKFAPNITEFATSVSKLKYCTDLRSMVALEKTFISTSNSYSRFNLKVAIENNQINENLTLHSNINRLRKSQAAQARRVKIIRICMGIPITNNQKDIYTQKFSIKKPYFIVLVTFSLSLRLFAQFNAI